LFFIGLFVYLFGVGEAQVLMLLVTFALIRRSPVNMGTVCASSYQIHLHRIAGAEAQLTQSQKQCSIKIYIHIKKKNLYCSGHISS